MSSCKATGTAEPGGWSTRELLSILDGLEDLSIVGADVGKSSWQPVVRSRYKVDIVKLR